MRLLIVEDEDLLREGLKKMIGRMNIDGLTVTAAENGWKALELLRERHFDVIITDIRMPKMDGLELVAKAHEWGFPVRSVILSGYDDFAYAKQALRLGCVEYLLKPPHYGELYQLLVRISKDIASERDRRLNEQREKLLTIQNLSTLRRDLLRELLSGSAVDTRLVRDKAQQLGLSLNGDQYRVAMFVFDHPDEIQSRMNERDRNLLKYAVSNIAEEIMDGAPHFYDDEDRLVVLCATDPSSDDDRVRAMCESVKVNVNRYLKLSVSAAVSSRMELSRLPEACRQCENVLNYRLPYGTGLVMTYDQVRLMKDNEHVGLLIKQLEVFAKADQPQMLVGKLQEWCGQMERLELTPKTLEKAAGEWKLLLLALIRQWSNDAELPPEYAKHHLAEQVEKATTFRGQLLPVSQLLTYIQNRNNVSKIENRLIEQAIHIIDEHYREPLTLAKISERLYINPAYFSVLFKRKVGKSVIQYLTEKRMDKAKELLSRRELTTYQIAGEVGYENPAYFSTLFKKYTGVTPQEYKKLKSM